MEVNVTMQWVYSNQIVKKRIQKLSAVSSNLCIADRHV